MYTYHSPRKDFLVPTYLGQLLGNASLFFWIFKLTPSCARSLVLSCSPT